MQIWATYTKHFFLMTNKNLITKEMEGKIQSHLPDGYQFRAFSENALLLRGDEVQKNCRVRYKEYGMVMYINPELIEDVAHGQMLADLIVDQFTRGINAV